MAMNPLLPSLSPNDKRQNDINKTINIMKNSKTIEEWIENCEIVQIAFGGEYPDFWYQVIGEGGIAREAFFKIHR